MHLFLHTTLYIFCRLYGFPLFGGSHTDNTFLDWFEPSTNASHPVFGRIMENYNLVLQISQVSTRNDTPVTPIRMISVRVT